MPCNKVKQMKQKLEILAEKIRNAHSIVIAGHKNPDGDSLCSMLAMARLIELNFGKIPVCVYDGNIPDYLDRVPGRDSVRYYEKLDPAQTFDMAIIVDYGDGAHLGGALDIVRAADTIVEIDHHKNANPLGQICFDDDAAAAAGQIIYRMMRAAGWRTDMDTLDLLGVAMLTDTGHFKFVRDGAVLRDMADLVDGGVSLRDLTDRLNNKTRSTILTESRVASRAEFFYHDRLALAMVPMRDYKYLDGRGDVILNLLGQIKNVEYVVLLKQQKENQIGISLRSRTHPINHIAEIFGGGGHLYAAGAVAHDTLENVRARIIELFKDV